MLIGICGQAGSGKDTVADYLCKHYGFVKVGFADPMKRFVQDTFDFSDDQIWGPSESRNAGDPRYVRMKRGALGTTLYQDGKSDVIRADSPREDVLLSPRYALQTIGTQWGRHCYSNVWVDYALRIHASLQAGGCIYDQKRGLVSVSYLDDPTSPNPMITAKTNVVISDVRFMNEVEGIVKARGHVVKIVRLRDNDKAVGIEGHASEEEQKSIPDSVFRATIQNVGTLNSLYSIIESIRPLLGISNGR